jgi:hypothetical protein
MYIYTQICIHIYIHTNKFINMNTLFPLFLFFLLPPDPVFLSPFWPDPSPLMMMMMMMVMEVIMMIIMMMMMMMIPLKDFNKGVTKSSIHL